MQLLSNLHRFQQDPTFSSGLWWMLMYTDMQDMLACDGQVLAELLCKIQEIAYTAGLE